VTSKKQLKEPSTASKDEKLSKSLNLIEVVDVVEFRKAQQQL
jgi:hypothetical protein